MVPSSMYWLARSTLLTAGRRQKFVPHKSKSSACSAVDEGGLLQRRSSSSLSTVAFLERTDNGEKKTDKKLHANSGDQTRDFSVKQAPSNDKFLHGQWLWKAPPLRDADGDDKLKQNENNESRKEEDEDQSSVRSQWVRSVDGAGANPNPMDLKIPLVNQNNTNQQPETIDPPPTTSTASMEEILTSIATQEKQGGRMKSRQMGVLTADPAQDMRLLMHNYTVPALASALRDREEALQHCATLMAAGDYEALSQVLRPFERRFVQLRRFKNRHLDVTRGYDFAALEMLRKGLGRMSRQITQAHQKRAGVVLPLCNVNGVACVLFEKRSRHLRAHPDEVCLPGGMVSMGDDKGIVVTCLREMEEEIGIKRDAVTVLGILRCNWGEVAQLTGVAVTPVVCFVGDLDEDGGITSSSGAASASFLTNSDPVNGQVTNGETRTHHVLRLNPEEVAECFTVPLASFLDKSRWIHRDDVAPVFTGGPYVIWGLTGYILDRFVNDVLARYTVSTSEEDGPEPSDSLE